MRILLVEDEKTLSGLLARNLKEEGYSVDQAFDGGEALLFLDLGSYDCIILDIMLPVKDGLSVLKTLRGRNISSPVLLLTAKDSIQDRVTGLDAGADDYLTKPFSYDELSARIRAMLRRDTPNKSVLLQFEDLSIDTITREVRRGDQLIELAAKEYSMLEYFMRNPRRVLTRSQILDHVWSFDFASDSNIVDVYVRYL
ncbi:MAG: response regulator transcription factor, partial [Deferribacteraceae bacterium]|nr:response regulator transcription factor [Deferribacteraceae bacterium]